VLIQGAVVDGASFGFCDLEGTGIQGVTRGRASYQNCEGIEEGAGVEGGD